MTRQKRKDGTDMIKPMESIIYVFSETNPWMQCLVFVDTQNAERAYQAVKQGIEKWYSDEYLTYGTGIGQELSEMEIPFVIEFCEYDSENDEPTDLWDKHIECIYKTHGNGYLYEVAIDE